MPPRRRGPRRQRRGGVRRSPLAAVRICRSQSCLAARLSISCFDVECPRVPEADAYQPPSRSSSASRIHLLRTVTRPIRRNGGPACRKRRPPGDELQQVVQRRDRDHRHAVACRALPAPPTCSPVPRSIRSSAISTPAGVAPCARIRSHRFAHRRSGRDDIVDDQHPARKRRADHVRRLRRDPWLSLRLKLNGRLCPFSASATAVAAARVMPLYAGPNSWSNATPRVEQRLGVEAAQLGAGFRRR